MTVILLAERSMVLSHRLDRLFNGLGQTLIDTMHDSISMEICATIYKPRETILPNHQVIILNERNGNSTLIASNKRRGSS